MLRLRHLVVALLLHAALLVLIMVGVYFHPIVRPLPVIEAVLVQVKRPPSKPTAVANPKPEVSPEEKPKPPEDKQEQEKLKLKEQEKQAELQRKADLQKKVELEKKRTENEQKVKMREEQERKSLMEAEEKRREDEKLKREQESEKRRQEELNAMLEKERAGLQATERDRWAALIRDKVQRNWTRPINSTDKFQCNVNVKILPGGTVVDVKLIGSCGSLALDDSVKRAVLKSDPLPLPNDPTVFDRNLNFLFVPGTN